VDAVARQLLWPDFEAGLGRGFPSLAVNVARTISCRHASRHRWRHSQRAVNPDEIEDEVVLPHGCRMVLQLAAEERFTRHQRQK
jgi:hypothetical protein